MDTESILSRPAAANPTPEPSPTENVGCVVDGTRLTRKLSPLTTVKLWLIIYNLTQRVKAQNYSRYSTSLHTFLTLLYTNPFDLLSAPFIILLRLISHPLHSFPVIASPWDYPILIFKQKTITSLQTSHFYHGFILRGLECRLLECFCFSNRLLRSGCLQTNQDWGGDFGQWRRVEDRTIGIWQARNLLPFPESVATTFYNICVSISSFIFFLPLFLSLSLFRPLQEEPSCQRRRKAGNCLSWQQRNFTPPRRVLTCMGEGFVRSRSWFEFELRLSLRW